MAADADRSPNETDCESLTVIVTNRDGLHARPSLAIVQTVGKYDAHVTVHKGSQCANASSALDLLSLGAAQGTELVLTATGPDSQQVLAELQLLFANEFGVTYDD